MLNQATVLVLGAGASVDYQMPLGSSLKKKIISMCNIKYEFGRPSGGGDEYRIFEAVRQIHPNDQKEFFDAVKQIGNGLDYCDSIDAYVEQQREDPKIVALAKYFIVYWILKAEADSCLQYDKHNGGFRNATMVQSGWYNALWKILTNGVPKKLVTKLFEPEINPLTIISFNYDRTFEQFAFHAIQHHYDIDELTALESLSKLKIIHPYGKIAPLPWQHQGNDQNYAFGNVGDLFHKPFQGAEINLSRLAKNIDTYSEAQMKIEKQQGIQNSFEQAKQIYFIGFAFHPQNTELILPSSSTRLDLDEGDILAATGKGMNKRVCKNIAKELLDKYSLPQVEDFINPEWDAQALMSEYEFPMREYKATVSDKRVD